MKKALKGVMASKEETLFDVDLRPVDVDGVRQNKFRAVKRTDNEVVLAIKSNKYVPVSNKKVMDTFGEIADAAEIAWSMCGGYLIRNGAKTIMKLAFPKSDFTVMGVRFKLLGYLINGFDGSSAARFHVGYLNTSDSSMSIIGDGDMQISYAHVGNINEKLVDTFKLYLGGKIDMVQNFINQMVNTDINMIEHFMVQSAKWIGGAKYHEVAMDMWEKGGKKANAWEVYNIFSHIINHTMDNINMDRKLMYMKRLNKYITNTINGQ